MEQQTNLPSMHEARKRKKGEVEHLQYEIPNHLKGLGAQKSYFIKTYGCQGNIADSEKIAGIMENLGYSEAPNEEASDVLFFNTCAIRDHAEKRVFGELGRLKGLKANNPHRLIALCGCMPQEESTIETVQKKYDQVDIVFGTHNIARLPQLLEKAYQKKERIFEVLSFEGQIIEDIPLKRGHNQKAWVDIMYGCDEFCTYCIVPYTRGTERSRYPEDIIREVTELQEQGYLEVTLLGQNVNAYGKDFTDRKYGFSDLLSDLQKTNIPRIRFTTSHPRDLDLRTMEVMAQGKNIMPHLHLPVQSGSNAILKRMNRKYTHEEYAEKIKMLRNLIPNIAITTDIIVGFPQETDEDFEATLELVRECQFEGAYTFIFSPRQGTPAANFADDIPDIVKKARLLKLNELINEGFARGNHRFEGETVEVLVEGVSEKKTRLLNGYTPHNKLVNFEGPEELIGSMVLVKIEKAYTWHLRGTLVK
ncbi:MAG: tRNA (N6-isopentenyl adenosine(37)-C2)-methylthiotransferase MiaB [Bacilli bacterium]|nr:tRNA (N6-isopentenyl adenosine(37)-C2)-methylthiotransferase MiaB [Bacilli bacterium]